MRDRLWLAAYLATVVGITMVHRVDVIAAVLLAGLLLAGRDAPRLARRAVVAVALFTLVVTGSYALATGWRGELDWGYLLLVHLRVFTLTLLTFLLARRVDLYRALGFSRTLLYALTLGSSQMLTLRRQLAEFRHGLASRSPRRPRVRDLRRHSAAIGALLVRKAMNDSTEIAQGMRSRGFFS